MSQSVIPYLDDPADLVSRLSPLGPVTLLDSGGADKGLDIAGVLPARELVLPGRSSPADVSAFLQHLHALQRAVLDRGDADRDDTFTGGLIGFFSYELGRRLRGLAPRPSAQPLAVVRDFPWAVVQHRASRRARIAAPSGFAPDADTTSRVIALLSAGASEQPGFRLLSPLRGRWDARAYGERFDRTMAYIAAGDCYQINLGQPYRAAYRGPLGTTYRGLRALARAPYSALFPLQDESVLLSLSPEMFLRVRGRRVETSPIKGTRPRAADPAEDRANAAALLASEKERAENLMIVDLLRNDIGRYCKAGSVAVDALFELESFATVHHLVSRVSGTLRDDVTPLELLLGCLPGGSITGAPKHRAMEIIDELEPGPRESWCGTIFSLSSSGTLESSILIRTLHGDGSTLTCWAGGGLVADSCVAEEYQELTHKVGRFLAYLEAL